jgi:hypothetical protein
MDDRIPADQDPTLDPEDVNSSPTAQASSANSETRDANDEVPVPIAMSPAEVDERAQAVEAMGGTRPAGEQSPQP